MMYLIQLLLLCAILSSVSGCKSKIPLDRTNHVTNGLTENEPGYKVFTKDFFKRLKAVVDVSDFQSWAVKTIDETAVASGIHEGLSQEMISIPKDKIPPFLAKLEDGTLLGSSVIFQTQTVKAHIAFLWGSGRGFYGILIGSSDFKPSKTFDYYIEWKPGVCIWHDTK